MTTKIHLPIILVRMLRSPEASHPPLREMSTVKVFKASSMIKLSKLKAVVKVDGVSKVKAVQAPRKGQ